MTEIVIPLPGGGTLRCGPGLQHRWGGHQRICDERGHEVLYWDSSEWEEEGELVIGAVFGAAHKRLAELTRDKELVEGVWVLKPRQTA